MDVIDDLLEHQLHALEDLNSNYPATREFLKARGLTNVREFDVAGREELRQYLERTLRLATN